MWPGLRVKDHSWEGESVSWGEESGATVAVPGTVTTGVVSFLAGTNRSSIAKGAESSRGQRCCLRRHSS